MRCSYIAYLVLGGAGTSYLCLLGKMGEALAVFTASILTTGPHAKWR